MKSGFTRLSYALALFSLMGCAGQTHHQEKTAQPETSFFYGKWRVAGVAVSDEGVQALEDNDPGLMGRRVDFTHDLLAWNSSLNTTEDTCRGPVLKPLPTASTDEEQSQLQKLGIHNSMPYGVHCNSGNWGLIDELSPTFFLAPDGSLALFWYDGGMLKLVRDK